MTADKIDVMSTLLEKAPEKVVARPQDEQDAIASQILASLADEDAWKIRFAEKRDVIRRMAREASKDVSNFSRFPPNKVDFLEKPFSASELTMRVGYLIGWRSQIGIGKKSQGNQAA